MEDTKSVKSLGIYCRVSSKKQMDNTSLENQRERGIRYCKNNGYGFEVYKDVISGNKVNRDGLNELYEKIYDGSLDGIVLYELDRLQRDNKELLIEFEKLIEDTNCLVVVDSKVLDINDNLSDRIEYELKNTMSTIERMRLKKRVGEGIQRMMERGNTLFGNCKFGYKNEGKKQTLHTTIDEKNGEIVKEIFRVFNLESTISFDVCRKKINEKYGKDFLIKFIVNCLKYDGYKGETTQKWGKEIYKVSIPKIISKELWDKTQIKVNKIQSLRVGRDKEFHLLKGIIYCKECDDRLYKYGKLPKNSDYSQSWYRCKWSLKPQYEKNKLLWENGKKCKCYRGNYISRQFLEVVVWDMLLKTLKESNTIKKEYTKRYNDSLKLKDSNKHSKKYYENLIEKENDKKFSLYNEYLDKKIKKNDYNLYNKGFDKNILKYEERIKEIDVKINSFSNLDKVDFDKIEELMKKDLDLKFDVKNNKDKRRLIDKYIDKIYLKRIDNENYYLNFEMKLSEEVKDISFNKTYIKNSKLYFKDSYICNFKLDIKVIFKIIRVKKTHFLYLFKYNLLNYKIDVI